MGLKRGQHMMCSPSLNPYIYYPLHIFLFTEQVFDLLFFNFTSKKQHKIVFISKFGIFLFLDNGINNMMKKIQQLKKILEKDDSQKGVESFEAILSEKEAEGGVIHVQDLNLLLRWAVTEQKKHFPKFYEILIKMGASVNFIDTRQKKSNLMIACERANIEIVESLVNSEGMNFMLEDSRKKNVLYYCIDNKNKEKGQKYIRFILLKCPQLLNKESNKNSIPLVAAIEKGRIQIIKTLLELGADPNEKIADNGNTPLHEAIKMWKSKPSQANQQIVQNLLQNGADPSVKNKQNKNALEMSQKLQPQLLKMIESARPSTVAPILKINTAEERQSIFDQAAAIFRENQFLIEEPPQSSDQESHVSSEGSEQGIEIYEQPRNFINKLSVQIHNFSQECMNDWSNAQQQLQRFLKQLQIITEGLSLTPYVYGSFATRLWLKHCDIDLLLIPGNQSPMQPIEWYLDEIYRRLKLTKNYNRASILKSIKVPMIRIEVQEGEKKKTPRKFDITVMGINHNGKHHVMYVTNMMGRFPVLQPLFYVVKKLSYYYKLNDPKNFGVRSYALVLMLALFLNDYPNPANLGELLLSFFYKFGYSYQYQYRHGVSEQQSMILNLPDPINPKNNVGSQTDACSLQRMFKTAYIILHTKGPQSKLSYLFDSRNIFSLRDMNN